MKDKQKLSRQYKVQLTLEVEEKLKTLAQESGLTMSAVIRECLQNSNPVFKQLEPVASKEERLRALRIIAKAGNNLNQIAHGLNTLNLKNELNYQKAVYYLRMIDNLEARLFFAFSRFESK